MDKKIVKSSHISQRIEEKRAELDSLNEIRKYSGEVTRQLQELESKLEDMAGGADSVALVLSNWQNVVRSVSLASIGLVKAMNGNQTEGSALPECLVRIRLNEDQEKDHISTHQANEEYDDENTNAPGEA